MNKVEERIQFAPTELHLNPLSLVKLISLSLSLFFLLIFFSFLFFGFFAVPLGKVLENFKGKVVQYNNKTWRRLLCQRGSNQGRECGKLDCAFQTKEKSATRQDSKDLKLEIANYKSAAKKIAIGSFFVAFVDCRYREKKSVQPKDE